jgi:hypothetical protein
MQARPDFESTDKDGSRHPAEEGRRVAGYPAAMQPVAPLQTFDDAGFELLPALLDADEPARIAAMLEGRLGVGERDLLDQAWCADLARRLRVDARVAHALPPTHVAVQCTSFEKSIDRNWLVPVHQDLAIPVVVAGSHRQGRIDDARAIALRNDLGTVACPLPRGAAMLMRPLLLHASSKATGTSQRRVLHFLFGPPQLPFGLAWA